MIVVYFSIFWIISITVILWLHYRSDLKRLWSEPILRYPVVIFESDDWGVGPDDQNSALSDLKTLLSEYSDSEGKSPVMTLGLVLAEPDFEQMRNEPTHTYIKRDLSSAYYHKMLNIINEGQKQKIFSIQLHGMEHFWPEALMSSLGRAEVKNWLYESESPVTENLPSFLQSRWCDTSELPSKPHAIKAVLSAIKSEINLYQTLFGQLPGVVVPPTFVWTDEIIHAYTNESVNNFVTPGRQYTGRDAEGKLISNNRTFYNGDIDQKTGAQYLVRDIYFEPGMGHKAVDAFEQIIHRTQCGRPALLEMHRFNFLSEDGELNKNTAMAELKCLLDIIQKQLPQTRYLSTERLANIFRSNNSQWIMDSGLASWFVRLARVQQFFQFNRLAKYSGFNFILGLILLFQKSRY